MRKILIGLIVLTVSSFAASMATVSADTYVNGSRRSDGTYVQPHHRSDRDGNPCNNYSHRGNVNPYTGERGYQR